MELSWLPEVPGRHRSWHDGKAELQSQEYAKSKEGRSKVAEQKNYLSNKTKVELDLDPKSTGPT